MWWRNPPNYIEIDEFQCDLVVWPPHHVELTVFNMVWCLFLFQSYYTLLINFSRLYPNTPITKTHPSWMYFHFRQSSFTVHAQPPHQQPQSLPPRLLPPRWHPPRHPRQRRLHYGIRVFAAGGDGVRWGDCQGNDTMMRGVTPLVVVCQTCRTCFRHVNNGGNLLLTCRKCFRYINNGGDPLLTYNMFWHFFDTEEELFPLVYLIFWVDMPLLYIDIKI